MPDNEKHANNSSSMLSDTSQSSASRYRQEDVPPPQEQIRGRAYELYVERGSQLGGDVADWLQAEREYYERP